MSTNKIRVTRRLEFDAGHRLPNHSSQCRHLHGHRYRLEITLSGKLQAEIGSSSEGMVLDFTQIKSIAQANIVDLWDHAFLVFEKDTALFDFLKTLEGHKTVALPVIPTAENLGRIAFEKLAPLYKNAFSNQLQLEKIRLYETPNNWADIMPFT